MPDCHRASELRPCTPGHVGTCMLKRREPVGRVLVKISTSRSQSPHLRLAFLPASLTHSIQGQSSEFQVHQLLLLGHRPGASVEDSRGSAQLALHSSHKSSKEPKSGASTPPYLQPVFTKHNASLSSPVPQDMVQFLYLFIQCSWDVPSDSTFSRASTTVAHACSFSLLQVQVSVSGSTS